MTTLAHIHEISVAIEKTLGALQQHATDEKAARAALLELYIAGINQGKAESEHTVQAICDNTAKALLLSKEALKAIVALEEEPCHPAS